MLLVEIEPLLFFALSLSFMQLWFRLVWKVGMVFLSFLPISNSDGKYPQSSGIDLYVDSRKVRSFSFFRSDLVVFTAHSAMMQSWGK